MRVIFLDMDGVMNSGEWLERTSAAREAEIATLTGYEQVRRFYLSMIDPAAVKLLDEIMTQTGAHVVVSSSWRSRFEPWQLGSMLAVHGLRHADRFIGKTGYGDRVRGQQIQAWLDESPGIESFVILDDDSDMAHLVSKLVQTDSNHGLKREHVDRAVRILRGES